MLGSLIEPNKKGQKSCLEKVLEGFPEKDFVIASFNYLRDTIRNRDAHRYTQNVRAFHFYAVERVIVPSLNTLLKLVDQDALRMQTSLA